MRFIVIQDNAGTDEIDAAISILRTKQLRSVIESTRAEVGADIDELLDLRQQRRAYL